MPKQKPQNQTPEKSVPAPTPDANIEANSSEPRFPALPLAVETLKIAYEEINSAIESIHTRASVGLTLIVTALAVVGFKIQLEYLQMFGDGWWIAATGYLSALGLVASGGWFLQKAILTQSATAAYSTQDLHEKECQDALKMAVKMEKRGWVCA